MLLHGRAANFLNTPRNAAYLHFECCISTISQGVVLNSQSALASQSAAKH